MMTGKNTVQILLREEQKCIRGENFNVKGEYEGSREIRKGTRKTS